MGTVTSALGKVGIELGAEVIFVYDYDLASSAQTLELLVGGEAGTELAKIAGEAASSAVEDEGGITGGGGVLVSATIPVNWSGSWKDVTFGVDAYTGGEIFGGDVAAGGGSWKVVWSTDPGEVGQTGYWGSAGGSLGGACSAGGVVFTSSSDLCVMHHWIDKLFGSSDDAGAPCSDAGKDARESDAGEAGKNFGLNEGGWGDGEAGKTSTDGGSGDGATSTTTCDNTQSSAPTP